MTFARIGKIGICRCLGMFTTPFTNGEVQIVLIGLFMIHRISVIFKIECLVISFDLNLQWTGYGVF